MRSDRIPRLRKGLTLNRNSSRLAASVTGSAAVTVSPASVSLAAGASASVTVKFNPAMAAAGDNSATLRLGATAHSVLYAFTK